MGAPRRIRRKFDKPKTMWDKQRIDEERTIKGNYGLKSHSELWKAISEVRRIRRNVREILSGRTSEDRGKEIIGRLSKYSIVKSGATLDDLLTISPEIILDRRLQTIVFRRGMAKSIAHSRQLIAHGFISIDGSRIKSPGYLVAGDEEGKIGYYKPVKLDINANKNTPAPAPAPEVKQKEEAKSE